MPKLTPKRTFLLRHVEGKDTIAHKGMKIEVTEEEYKKLPTYFVEGPPKSKKKLSVE